MTVAAARPHTDAVAAAIAAAGLLVGRGGQPDGSGWQGQEGRTDHVPYAVVYPTPGMPDGNLADPNEYLDYTVQVTCVAASQEGAEAAIDTVKTALVGVQLAVAGRAAYPMYVLLEQPVRRDDQVSPPVHYSVIQLRARTQPA